MLKKIFFALTLTLTLTTFAATPPQNTITFTQNNKPITVSQKNPTFSITLPSNATTGYQWSLKSMDSNLISLVTHKYVPPTNTKMMGAPGYEVWTFKAVPAQYAVNQVGHVVMQYARPWTTSGATSKTFMVVVKK